MQSSLQTSPDNLKILKSVFHNFYYSIQEQEFDSLANRALYETKKNFNPNKGKFESLLSRNMTNACNQHLRKRSLTTRPTLGVESYKEPTREEVSMKDCVDSLPANLRKVIIQKYYQGFTLEEIGEANGYSSMTALRNVREAENAIKELYLDA